MSPSFDFVLSFERQGDRYVVRGGMRREITSGSPFSLKELETALSVAAPEMADPAAGPADLSQVTRLGRSLYETALSRAAEDWFEQFQKEVEQRGAGLRINLDFTRASELASLPWEYLYSPSTGFLSLSLRHPLRRSVASYGKPRELPIGRSPYLRVLEVGKVGTVAGRSPRSYEIRHDRLDRITPEDLYRQVRAGDYDVLHFGRGALDSLELGGVRIGQLGEILAANPPLLTVLDAVGTGGGETWLSAGSAPMVMAAEGLVRQGLPAVISIPGGMMGPAADRFEEQVYEGMAAGAPVDAAVAEARQAVRMAEGPEGTTWGLPTLYTNAGLPTLALTRSPSVSFRGMPDIELSSPGPRFEGTYGAKSEPDVPEAPPPYPPHLDTPPPGPPPPPPQRYLLGSFPASVRLGDRVALQVRIALKQGGADERSAPLREVMVPPEGLNALLVLHSPGFETLGGNSRNVTIPQTRDSDPVVFELKAVREGIQALEVSAYADGYLGALRIETTVDSAAATGESREHRQNLQHRPGQEGGYLVLEIHFDPATQLYSFRWIDSLIPLEEQTKQLKQTPQQAIEALIRELNEQAGGMTSYTAEQTQRKLRNKGIGLWRELIPEDLQRRFWKQRDRIKRLLIVSEGDPIPWELLYPVEPETSDGDGFLAEQLPISRWLRRSYDDGPPVKLRLSNAAFVGPDDSLPHARREIETIRGILAGRGAQAQEAIQRLNPLLELLDQRQFDLLHFACHNQFETVRIMLGDQGFDTDFLVEHKGRFRELAPLIFLNACHSDAHLPQYTQLGGWAHSFLQAGAGAFVGTLWQVRDQTASAFAEAFYRALTPGARLGDALQQARMEIRDVAGDPTWLAYSLYGDTLATFE